MSCRSTVVSLFSLVIIALPNIAFANAGIPLIAIFLPPMWLGLVLVIIIEAFINSRILSIPFRKTVLPTTVGNIVSTIAGIPILWVVLSSIEAVFFGNAIGLRTASAKLYAVTIQSPWLIPYERDLWWMIPAALLVFSVPCFAISVLIEAPINRLGLPNLRPRAVWKATGVSNLASYIFLGFTAYGYGTLSLQGGLRSTDKFFIPIWGWIAEIVFHIASLFISK